ncbi:MAG: NADH-quinone oxidoreductase subunit J [Deltaproteobacteria bacterium]|nr:NADH-quinone oxidoreductase subunit J [Deltaproteobacteria bacterium]
MTKSLEIAFFALCAALVLGGGVITVGARRPVRSALGLLVTIVGVAGCYLMLAAELLAAIQLIVYAGAVVVLFIFVVMLLGPAATSPTDARSALPRYVGAGALLLASAGALVLLFRLGARQLQAMPRVPPGFGTIERVGLEIFTAKLVPFELTGALLLVAVVGALAVARGKHPDPTRDAAEAASPPHPAEGKNEVPR